MNPLWFDESTYLANKLAQLQTAGENYSSVQQVRDSFQNAKLTPYEHYVLYGDMEGINPNPFFTKVEYLEAKAIQMNNVKQDGRTNWDAASAEQTIDAAGMTVGEHFVRYGWMENVNPSNSFDVSTYLADKVAQLGSGNTVAGFTAVLAEIGLDPVGHYMAFGTIEGLHNTVVPVAEQVVTDPTQPRPAVLSADGKVIKVHLQSPLVAASVEKEDFSIKLGDSVLSVDTVAVASGTDNAKYDLLITLKDESRVAGLGEGGKSNLQVVYDPAGGPKALLATEAGLVAGFNKPVENLSQCFLITERVSTEYQTDASNVVISSTNTLHITLTPPTNYVQPSDVTQFVKVDLSASAGVVSGGAYGIVTAPRLMDGKLVQKLDTTGASEAVRLNIVAGSSGSEITTSNAADQITLGGGTDKVNYTSLTTSQLSHMDTIEKFTCSNDKLVFGAAAQPLINKVLFMGPLSLEGQVNEASIKGVFWNTPMAAATAYLLQNGKDYIFVADANGDGVFSADADFVLQLVGVSGAPTTAIPGADLTSMFV